MNLSHTTIAAATVAGLTGLASAAIPVMTIGIQSSGGGSGAASPVGAAVSGSPNQYRYTADLNSAGRFVSQFTLYAMDTSATDRQVIGGLISVINATASVQTYTVDISASTIARSGSSLVGGSMSGALADNQGSGAFFAIGGTAGGWSGWIVNGSTPTQVGSLFATPTQVTTAPWQTASIAAQNFGLPGPTQSAIGMGDAASIKITFQLGAYDKVDLTTAFVVAVPAPGALAIAAIAGVVFRGRRRRA
jgi:hypothetical protein